MAIFGDPLRDLRRARRMAAGALYFSVHWDQGRKRKRPIFSLRTCERDVRIVALEPLSSASQTLHVGLRPDPHFGNVAPCLARWRRGCPICDVLGKPGAPYWSFDVIDERVWPIWAGPNRTKPSDPSIRSVLISQTLLAGFQNLGIARGARFLVSGNLDANSPHVGSEWVPNGRMSERELWDAFGELGECNKRTSGEIVPNTGPAIPSPSYLAMQGIASRVSGGRIPPPPVEELVKSLREVGSEWGGSAADELALCLRVHEDRAAVLSAMMALVVDRQASAIARRFAASTLGKLGGRSAIPTLIEAVVSGLRAKSRDDEYVGSRALTALCRIDRTARDPRVRLLLRHALRWPIGLMFWSAAECVESLGFRTPESAADILVSAMLAREEIDPEERSSKTHHYDRCLERWAESARAALVAVYYHHLADAQVAHAVETQLKQHHVGLLEQVAWAANELIPRDDGFVVLDDLEFLSSLYAPPPPPRKWGRHSDNEEEAPVSC
jgi:hypothetical protein